MMSRPPLIKVCEFYSGMGGYHVALSQIPNITYTVAAAFEISSNANCIYRTNFPETSVFETNLCGLTASKLDSIISKSGEHSRDQNEGEEYEIMFVMSPPCQPFTRQGVRKDDLDPRSESVLHLFQIFSDLSKLPDYFMLENVQGFEGSNTRNKIMEFFVEHQYHVTEFLVNSNNLGIPNSRLRYYLLARKSPFPNTVPSSFPDQGPISFIPGLPTCPTPSPLSTFLETEVEEKYFIPEKFLSKWGWVLDIVTPQSVGSCCFTKGYTVKAEGSGSVIQLAPDHVNTDGSRDRSDVTPLQQVKSNKSDSSKDGCSKRSQNERSMSNSLLDSEEFLKHMIALKLRFFTPREIARVHGIPESYSFPTSLSDRQLYKLLGNGLNVSVVKMLIESILLS